MANFTHPPGALTENLRRHRPPMPLIAQYLPLQAETIRAGLVENNPDAMIGHQAQGFPPRYSFAFGSMVRDSEPYRSAPVAVQSTTC
jgi:tagatose-1,6-bisphosphate aldolase non-catalytic subunit AgaZ/GatZ